MDPQLDAVLDLPLTLREPFRLAHGSSTVRRNLLVQVRRGDLTGLGEAAVVPYYPWSEAELRGALEALAGKPLPEADPGSPGSAAAALGHLPPPARAAVDMALWDLLGKERGEPLHRLLGLDPARCPPSSMTVSMVDTPDPYRTAVRDAARFGLVKLKLGSGDPEQDLERVRLAREVAPAAPLCADANGGWSPARAAALIPRLAPFGLLFVEQPVPTGEPGAWAELRAALPPGMPPLFADESLQTADDLPALQGLADGVNVKLAKAGGPGPACELLRQARALGFQTMVGCMVESSLGVTAAAHLAPLAHYADLDGHLLLASDPFRGLEVQGPVIHLPRGPGLGVRTGDRGSGTGDW